MAFTNETKNTTTLTNQDPSPPDNLTIDDATITIDNAEGTIDDPRTPYSNQTKNSTTLTNETKN